LCALQVAVSPDLEFPIRLLAVANPDRPNAKSALTFWTLTQAGGRTIHAFLPTVTFEPAVFCQYFAKVSMGYATIPECRTGCRLL
jgi:hypothetical protein